MTSSVSAKNLAHLGVPVRQLPFPWQSNKEGGVERSVKKRTATLKAANLYTRWHAWLLAKSNQQGIEQLTSVIRCSRPCTSSKRLFFTLGASLEVGPANRGQCLSFFSAPDSNNVSVFFPRRNWPTLVLHKAAAAGEVARAGLRYWIAGLCLSVEGGVIEFRRVIL